MPKRRKYKDNPYTLEYINNKCYIKFKDSKDILQVVEVSKEIHDVFNEYELLDTRHMHEYDRHIEHSELLDSTLYKRSINDKYNLEEDVEDKIIREELLNAINELTETQKRRLNLYYFEGKTLKEISSIDNCSITSVKESIDSGIEKIEKLIK